MSQIVYNNSNEFLATHGKAENERQTARALQDIVASPGAVEKLPLVGRAVQDFVGSVEDVEHRQRVYVNSQEFIASSVRRTRGLDLVGISVPTFTLFCMISLTQWAGGGNKQFGLIGDSPSEGFFLRETADPTVLQFIVQIGFKVRIIQTFTVANLADKHIFSIRRDVVNNTISVRFDRLEVLSIPDNTDLGQFLFKYIGGILQDGQTQDHQIAQMLMYANALTDNVMLTVENYLYCKWVAPGPTEDNNFCVPI